MTLCTLQVLLALLTNLALSLNFHSHSPCITGCTVGGGGGGYISLEGVSSTCSVPILSKNCLDKEISYQCLVYSSFELCLMVITHFVHAVLMTWPQMAL